MKTEREIFKQAYLNLRTADSIPFPDAVFDEYVRLRDSEGYKLVPLEINDEIESAMFSSVARGGMPCEIYKAMIGVHRMKKLIAEFEKQKVVKSTHYLW